MWEIFIQDRKIPITILFSKYYNRVCLNPNVYTEE